MQPIFIFINHLRTKKTECKYKYIKQNNKIDPFSSHLQSIDIGFADNFNINKLINNLVLKKAL